MEKVEEALIKLAIESWRFAKVFERAIQKADPREQKKFRGRLDWYQKQIEQSLSSLEYRLQDFGGKEYDAGMPLTPANLAEFGEQEQLIVDYALEPVIIDADGKIIHHGTAMMRRK